MFKFLGLLLLIVIFAFLILGVFLGRVIRTFGPTDKTKSSNHENNNNYTPDPPQKKFSKKEGEYVSYEEIKDDE
ncbi:hypothetical protein FACS1894179_09720 [Bacteroidia bacterium]|nr:hypothetical protein FACS1894179_09720 [Bacteroidia bacterium]